MTTTLSAAVRDALPHLDGATDPTGRLDLVLIGVDLAGSQRTHLTANVLGLS